VQPDESDLRVERVVCRRQVLPLTPAATVIGANSRKWFEFYFIPLIPFKKHVIWICTVCRESSGRDLVLLERRGELTLLLSAFGVTVDVTNLIDSVTTTPSRPLRTVTALSLLPHDLRPCSVARRPIQPRLIICRPAPNGPRVPVPPAYHSPPPIDVDYDMTIAPLPRQSMATRWVVLPLSVPRNLYLTVNRVPRAPAICRDVTFVHETPLSVNVV
jgi:hypothetical protein